jgi:peptidoglycan hydrolase CwlO-like protein
MTTLSETELRELINSYFNQLNKKLDVYDSRFDQLDKKLDAYDSRFDQLDKKLDVYMAKTDERLKAIEENIKDLKDQINATNARFWTLIAFLGTGFLGGMGTLIGLFIKVFLFPAANP